MSDRLSAGDIVIHRILGRGRIQAVYYSGELGFRARVYFFHKRRPRMVLLRDCEKEPAPLAKPEPLRVVS